MQLADGWTSTLSAPRGLAGANGMQIGPDGRLYVVSAFGGEIAAIDVDSGERTIISPQGDGIASPDDLAFDSNGVMYVSECMDARVSSFEAGVPTVVADELPGANGIATLGERIFVNECRPAGRMFEVFAGDREPRLLAEDLELPNGMCAGPDGNLYFVLVFSGKLARMPVDGGPVEIFVAGLQAPSSARWGPDGFVWVSQGGSGEVVKVDPLSAEVTTVAKARPGIDNLAITADGRLFVSYYIDGQVLELLDDGSARELVPRGLLAPYGVAAAAGSAYVADGMQLVKLAPGSEPEALAKYTDPGFPGYITGIDHGGGRLVTTTSAGAVCGFDPEAGASEVLADGLDRPRGLAVRPDGAILVAEAGRGRVLVLGSDGSIDVLLADLGFPADVAVGDDGAVFVSDEAAGAVLAIDSGGGVRTIEDGLSLPCGLAVADGMLYLLEVGGRRLSARPLSGGSPVVIATEVPVGLGDGGSLPVLAGLPELIPGPLVPFAGLAAEDGRLYVSCDAIGSVAVLGRG